MWPGKILLNRGVGWALVAAYLVCAGLLAPWAFPEPNATAARPSPEALSAYPMLAVMGLLQLATAHLLTSPDFSLAWRPIVSRATGLGTFVLAVGYVLSPRWPSAAWLISSGALLNLMALIGILFTARGQNNPAIPQVLSVTCFGMAMVALMGLFQWNPELLPAYLGPQEGLRLSMLRLARVAAIALPVLTLLYQSLATRAGPQNAVAERGRTFMLCGMIGLPAILAASSSTHSELKLLLPLPATAILVGTLCGVWLARKYAAPTELWGWLLIGLSMGAGLLMGLYAFDPPFPLPDLLVHYNNPIRRLIRLTHHNSIVLGFITIFVSRELEEKVPIGRAARIGARMLVVAGLLTTAVPLLFAWTVLPDIAWSFGPILFAIALVLCLGPSQSAPLGLDIVWKGVRP